MRKLLFLYLLTLPCLPGAQPYGLEHALYAVVKPDYGKAEPKTIHVDVQGIVFDMVNGLPAHDALVTLYDQNGNPTGDSLRTGSDGRYRFRLEGEQCFTLQAEKQGYKTTAQDNICSKGFEKSSVIKINLSLYPLLDYDGFLVENPPAPELVLTISHGFDQSDVPQDQLPVLEKLVELMALHPEWVVEVVSHTDTRGSEFYNAYLSLRRADAIGGWLVEHGIDRERLVITAKGESQPLFDCGEKEPCTEVENRANRRTVLLVRG